MFLIFKMVMDMTETQQRNLAWYNVCFLKMHKIDNIHYGVKTRLPSNMAKTKRTVTRGAHSILNNFPVPCVFEVRSHACVSLKE